MDAFINYLNHSKLDIHPYQIDGVKWCIQNETIGNNISMDDENQKVINIKGGFVADEMGLGKTIMMIGTFLSNFVPKTLIVLPVALVKQWYQQIYKTSGHKAFIFHGKNKKNKEKLLDKNTIIIITTYAAVSLRKEEKDTNILHTISWDRIVFDEAHHLRNKNTVQFSGVLELKTSICWLISGTPIQNCKNDFYNLCSILKIPATFYKNKNNMPILMESFILRRTKKEVGIHLHNLDIREKNVEWKNKKEMFLSESIHSYLPFSHVSLNEKEINTNNETDNNDKDRLFQNKRIIQIMMRAKQSCIYPLLMKSYLKGTSMASVVNNSSKLDAVVQLLIDNKDNDNGKIVFCHYRLEIDEIAKRLLSAGITKVVTLDGRNSFYSRSKILSEKNNVLIIQIQTGCEGLNLQEYFSEIYFVSPHWNPAVEDQAIARCHRIGQKKEVTVYRFNMSCEMMEENINSYLYKINKLLPSNVKNIIFDYISFQEKWLTIDKYIVNTQERKREIIKELLL